MGSIDIVVVLHAIEIAGIAAVGLFALGAYHEVSRLERRMSGGLALPPATRLRKGDPLGIDLGVPLGNRAFVVFMSYGCSGCVDLSRKLSRANLPNQWSLLFVMRDNPEQADRVVHAAGLPSGGFEFPQSATVLHDTERRWFHEVGIEAYPAVVAVVGGKVVDQEVGPNVEWFVGIERRRLSSASELLKVGGVT